MAVDQVRFVEWTFTVPGGNPPFTLDITHPGLTETFKAAVIFLGLMASDDTNQNQWQIGVGLIGIDSGTGYSKNACGSSSVQHNVASVVAGHGGRGSNDDQCIQIL